MSVQGKFISCRGFLLASFVGGQIVRLDKLAPDPAHPRQFVEL